MGGAKSHFSPGAEIAEEINRLVIAAPADILKTPTPDGDQNLIKEGISREKIQPVGNIRIDPLKMLRHAIEAQSTCSEKRFNL